MALSFAEDLSSCYSFARRYRKTPFCGGFVSESPKRYVKNGRAAKIRVYKIPVTEKEFLDAKKKCLGFEKMGEKTVYNNFSAVMSLVHMKVKVKNAYTCVEFIAEILNDISSVKSVSKKKWYSVDSLMMRLERFKVYTGSFPTDGAEWGMDRYDEKLSFLDILYEEVSSNGRLIYNAITARENKRREESLWVR